MQNNKDFTKQIHSTLVSFSVSPNKGEITIITLHITILLNLMRPPTHLHIDYLFYIYLLSHNNEKGEEKRKRRRGINPMHEPL